MPVIKINKKSQEVVREGGWEGGVGKDPLRNYCIYVSKPSEELGLGWRQWLGRGGWVQEIFKI